MNIFGRTGSGRVTIDAIGSEAQRHGRWLQGQLLAFLELKRQDVHTRMARGTSGVMRTTLPEGVPAAAGNRWATTLNGKQNGGANGSA